MDEPTRRALRALNRRFYDHHAESFSRSRGRAWPGWRRLLPHLASVPVLRVLDAGCGNARFASFLAESLPGRRLDYLGLDSSKRLLDAACRRLATTAEPPGGLRARLDRHDLIEDGPPSDLGSFHLVVLFGVLHHVPGREERLDLVRRLGKLLLPDALMAISLWRFDRLPRFAAKRVPWERLADDVLCPGRLEEGDHLLGWGGETKVPRYCHLTSDSEADELVRSCGLRLCERFTADGASQDLNLYLLLGS
jgi:SAM-dependent methyltransferase